VHEASDVRLRLRSEGQRFEPRFHIDGADTAEDQGSPPWNNVPFEIREVGNASRVPRRHFFGLVPFDQRLDGYSMEPLLRILRIDLYPLVLNGPFRVGLRREFFNRSDQH
jgi:hypothetical protein